MGLPYEVVIPPKKKGKYGNIKTEHAGRTFDSKHEAYIAQILETSRRATDPAKRVVELEYQVVFPIVINKEKVCKYIADFRATYADGHVEVIDAKSPATKKDKTYRLKKKLVKAVHGIEIIEM